MIKQDNIEFQANLYESNNPTRRWIHKKRRDWVINQLVNFSSKDKSVLEVGTGCGIYTTTLVKLFGSVTTIDINPEFVKYAKCNSPTVDSYVANIETYFDEKKHDVILMTEVIEHVNNTKLSLKSVYENIKPGGVFILTTPNKFSTTELVARLLKIRIFAVIARKIYREPVDELGHINLRTRGELIKEINQTGFTIESRSDISFYLPVIAEWGGERGASMLKFTEKHFSKTSILSHLLWTQCYVLRKAQI